MSKLEIKHIAKRLPYGLKIRHNDGGVSADLLAVQSNVEVIVVRSQSAYRMGLNWQLIHCKPILFHLSALIQEITVNGEAFVPMIRLMSSKYNIKEDSEIIKNHSFFNNHFGDIAVKSECRYKSSYFEFSVKTPINQNSNWVVEKLLQWHFDTDNLIEQNIAISVFDLPENPYTNI